MADKDLTPAQKRAATIAKKKAEEEAAAAEEAARKDTENKRLKGAGAVLAAIALFAGGFAVGESSGDDNLIAADTVDDRPFSGDDEDRRGPRDGDRRGPRGDLPEGFNFPEDFELPEGFEFGERFPGPGGFGFDLPEGFEFPDDFPFDEDGEGFGFSLECNDGECTFQVPEGFEFSGPGSPFGGGDEAPDDPPGDASPFTEPGFLGVSVTDGPAGVVVAGLDPGSPAADVGIEPGDVFVSVDGVAIATVDDLVGTIAEAGAGTEVEVTMDRGGAEVSFEVVLAERPA